ncbi:DUF1634 domain-containing protein [Pedobacter sp. MC2016-14]|uniref:DUF1634 domain-containing protein n=1 Tax=Pedobacter sp. MC2016-14 TaxID=2897327 RepID=UPI001E422AA6|nr:DUF1634 domain-containing protein [Pedobacter sp. MC2016-14]MCD0487995.1 DUF1634 domain-containing protein [Pedobacter sp. MC2016-14]
MRASGKKISGDKDIQVILGTLLRAGVVAAMTVVFIGGILYLLMNSYHLISYAEFDSTKAKYASITAVFAGLRTMDGAAIIQFGVLLLIFTPITRVLFSVFGFLIERDYMYVIIGLFVLAVILFSLSNKLVG